MQQITFTKRADGTYRKIVSERVFEGYTPEPAYQPEHIGRIPKDQVESVYMSNRKYNQHLSELRKEQLWQEIVSNRQQLANIVLTRKHIGNRVISPNKQEVSMLIKGINAVNRVINSIFEHTSTPYSQIQQMQLS